MGLIVKCAVCHITYIDHYGEFVVDGDLQCPICGHIQKELEQGMISIEDIEEAITFLDSEETLDGIRRRWRETDAMLHQVADSRKGTCNITNIDNPPTDGVYEGHGDINSNKDYR